MMIDRQRGMALAIVLWFLAGMSLLVSGIVYQARMDTRMAQLHLARATAVSAGDGAILLMLANLVSGKSRKATDSERLSRQFTVGTQAVSVVMVPTTALVNLNGASATTLTKLFTAWGQLTPAEAQTLADNVVTWRDQPGRYPFETPGGNFQSTEDVLQVAGMTRSLWDAMRDAVVVEGGASMDVPDVAGAPDSVKPVFGEDSPDASSRAGVRDEKVAARGGLATSYRVDAMVSYGGRTWLRRKWAVLGGGLTNQLPWRFSRVEAPRVLAVEQPAH